MLYIVNELVGNFSHTVAEFNNIDEASEFVMDKARINALEAFEVGFTPENSMEELEYEEALENALSYYTIETIKD